MKGKKKRIFDIIQIGKREDFISRAFDIFIVVVILANIAVLFLETFDSLRAYTPVFKIVETVTVIIFVVEYALRVWTAEFLYPDCSRWKATLKFLVSFDGIVELCTILPFFFLSGFVALRMLRVVRIFHLFRINAYYDSFHVITSVLKEKKNQIISSVFIILVLMLFSSLGMYSAEHEAQPDKFNNAFSGIWWSMSTILTVGYGDVYPVTILGRLMAIIISFLGVGVVAIPTGIISAGFVEQYTRIQSADKAPAVKMTGTVVIDGQSPLCKMTIQAIEKQHPIDVVILIRNGQVVLPVAATVTKQGDTLIYQADQILMLGKQ